MIAEPADLRVSRMAITATLPMISRDTCLAVIARLSATEVDALDPFHLGRDSRATAPDGTADPADPVPSAAHVVGGGARLT